MEAPTTLNYLEAIEAAISRFIPCAKTPPASIHEAMHYCLKAGGKRLRPTLLLVSAELYGPVADPLPAAVAVECLHTYSLVHDDLPAMDDSPLRRGQPSAHVQFGEALAILTGDALLTEAFRLISHYYGDFPKQALALIQCLSTAADSQHLIGGQVLDTMGENAKLSPAELETIHRHKTADLITASLSMGLHLTTAPPEAHAYMQNIGQKLGIAFQIVDDILDATASSEILGKPVGNDARLKKNTHVSIHGLQASRETAHRLTSEAIETCMALPDTNPNVLVKIIDDLANRLS